MPRYFLSETSYIPTFIYFTIVIYDIGIMRKYDCFHFLYLHDAPLRTARGWAEFSLYPRTLTLLSRPTTDLLHFYFSVSQETTNSNTTHHPTSKQ